MEFIRQYRSQRSTLTAQTFTGSISLTSSLPRSPGQSIVLPEQSRQAVPRSYRMGIEVWRFTICNVRQRSRYSEPVSFLIFDQKTQLLTAGAMPTASSCDLGPASG